MIGAAAKLALSHNVRSFPIIPTPGPPRRKAVVLTLLFMIQSCHPLLEAACLHRSGAPHGGVLWDENGGQVKRPLPMLVFAQRRLSHTTHFEMGIRDISCASEIGFDTKCRDKVVVSDKNHYEKHNDNYLMLEAMTMKVISFPVMNNIHQLVGESN